MGRPLRLKASRLTYHIASHTHGKRHLLLKNKDKQALYKICASNPSPDNTITTTVEIVEPMGDEAYIYLAASKGTIIAHVDSYEQLCD